jgi:hypothetical protein
LFGFATESDSKTTLEAYKLYTGETKIVVLKPPGNFILGNILGVELPVNGFGILEEPAP